MPKFSEIKSKLTRSVEPAFLPVTLTEAKRFLDLGDTTTEDPKLEDWIPVAVEMVERHSQRALVKQTWKLYLDEFPCGTIELRRPPVQSVSSITYTDGNGDEQTVSSSDYETDLKSAPGRIVPVTTWPSAKCMPNAVTVTFIAILELVREGLIDIVQKEPFAPIHVRGAGPNRHLKLVADNSGELGDEAVEDILQETAQERDRGPAGEDIAADAVETFADDFDDDDSEDTESLEGVDDLEAVDAPPRDNDDKGGS